MTTGREQTTKTSMYQYMNTNNDDKWLEIDRDTIPPDKLRFFFVRTPVDDDETYRSVVVALNKEYGFHWYTSTNSMVSNTGALLLDWKEKDFMQVDIGNKTMVHASTTHSDRLTPLEAVEKWIDLHTTQQPTTKEQPMSEPTNKEIVEQPPANKPISPTNPFDGMIDYIANEVTRRLGQSISEERIAKLVNDIMAKQNNRVLITIENKRNNSKVEINEPVHKSMMDVIGVLKAGCWVAVVGPSGGGKTLGGLQYAKACSVKHVGIKQMNQMLMPHDLIGFIDAAGHYNKGAWTDAIVGRTIESGTIKHPDCDSPGDEESIIIIDEMDNANSNIIMLVKALATGQIAMPYGLQRINPNLCVMATMNTWGNGATREYVGRMAQDAALLNEFQFVEWDYDTDFEWELLQQTYHSFKSPGEYKVEDMLRLHEMFKSMRNKAEQQKVRVIISTRNLINVAKLLLSNPEWPIIRALKMSVFKGLKEEEVKRIEAPEHWTSRSKPQPPHSGEKKPTEWQKPPPKSHGAPF